MNSVADIMRWLRSRWWDGLLAVAVLVKAMKKLSLWLLVFVLPILIGVLSFSALPRGVREWVGGTVIAVWGVLRLRSWWKRKSEEMTKTADQNELDYLDELVKEHEEGSRDNRQAIEFVVDKIKENQEYTAGVSKHIDNARLALNLDPKVLNAKLNELLQQEIDKYKGGASR